MSEVFENDDDERIINKKLLADIWEFFKKFISGLTISKIRNRLDPET